LRVDEKRVWCYYYFLLYMWEMILQR
jgi:hypothetical protein